MHQPSGPRRAWGAPAPPKPAAERRAEVMEPPPAPAAAVHPLLRPPPAAAKGKAARKKLGGLPQRGGPAEALSPRQAVPAGPQQLPPAAQLKEQPQAAGAAAQRPDAIPALRRPSHVPQPSTQALQAASLAAQLVAGAWKLKHAPHGSLQSQEEEDAVLIGSTAASFLQPAAQGTPLLPPHLPPAQRSGSGSRTAQLPRRASFLSTQLSSGDLSLSALAASRRVTQHSSARGSLPSSAEAPASPAAPPAEQRGGSASAYLADFEPESPGAEGAAPPPAPAAAPPSAQLSSGELALLRRSLLELQLPVSGSQRDIAASAAQPPDIPDRVVLQELGSRLGRLGSQQRRVLLQVLAKIDGMAAGGGSSHPSSSRQAAAGRQQAGSADAAGGKEAAAAAAAAQLIADSLGSSAGPSLGEEGAPGRASDGGPATLPLGQADGPTERQQAAAPGPASQLPSLQHTAVSPAPAVGQPGAGGSPGLGPQVAAPPAAAATQPSPGKGGLITKLAALRLGRSSSLVARTGPAPTQSRSSGSGSGDGSSSPVPLSLRASFATFEAARRPPAAPAAPAPTMPPARPRAGSPGAGTAGGTKLHSITQQRHRERSRLSVDGMRGGPTAARPQGSRRSSSPGADALAAFEQQHAGGAEPPALQASPTSKFLEAGWQQQEAPAGPSPAARRTSSGGGGGGGGSAECLIPSCPSGSRLELRIWSTWGDPHYVGLAGIELFGAQGQPLAVRDRRRQVDASPHSVNVLPGYGSDPRTPDKLLDGVNLTSDDTHMWLAPFTRGGCHTVTVTLGARGTLGALRVWNYNKDRVGSLRGARHVEMLLDGARIFSGELRQAPGSAAEALQHAELILFTEEAAALAAIEQHSRQHMRQPSPPAFAAAQPAHLDLVTAAAAPAGPLARAAALPVLPQQGASGQQQLGPDGRPLTAALGAPPAPLPLSQERRATGSTSGTGQGSASGAGLLQCRELVLVLLESWGDSHFVGLSGLQVLGPDQQPLPLSASQVAADPTDLNVFPGHSGDIRTVDKLVDGTANTTDDVHMWLAPVRRQLSASVAAACSRPARNPPIHRGALPEAAQPHNVLLLRLARPDASPLPVWGLLIHNYNKNLHDTARGVKRMLVLADGVEVSPPGGVLVRRAPGTAAVDFGQTIRLSPAWRACTAGGRRRSSLQHGGTRQPAPGSQAGQPQPLQPLASHSESMAWVCSLPDPAAALQYLQRAALLSRAAGPGGPLVAQPSENFATPLPCGFNLKLVLVSSWGCPHYVGLSGLEVRDAVRGPLALRVDQVWAAPASVALLPGLAADARTPDKLVDGNNSGAPQHSWLAPLEPRKGNTVSIMLDAPVLLGCIRVWNYAKTPSRGVQELEVYLDEHLVWKGALQRAPAQVAPGEDWSQALCFSAEALQEAAAAARRRAAALGKAAGGGQSGAAGGLLGAALGAQGVDEWSSQQGAVILFNEGQCVAFPPDAAAAPPTARPGTALVAA